MAFFDFLGNLGQKAQDAAQNIPGADAIDQVGQNVSDVGAGIGDTTRELSRRCNRTTQQFNR